MILRVVMHCLGRCDMMTPDSPPQQKWDSPLGGCPTRAWPREGSHNPILRGPTTRSLEANPPGNPPLANYKSKIPKNSLLVKVFSGCVPVRCVETSIE